VNGKIVSAFLTGAVLASGIVYMAVRPTAPKALQIGEVQPAPVELPPPPPAVTQKPIEMPAPIAKPAPVHAPKPVPQRARLAQTPIRPKPSPMPPVRREEPVMVARAEPKVEAPTPAPAQPTPDPPQPVATPAPPPPPPAREPVPVRVEEVVSRSTPEAQQPHRVVLAAGTRLIVRIGETISSAHQQIGDTFIATLEQPLVIDGFIICERGSRVIGKVTQATPAGRAGGQSHLGIELTRLNTSDRQRVDIRTETYTRDGSGSTGSDLAKIGAGTAIGAAIGAIAGGGKGAAIGAGAGAAAGTGAVLIANGKSVEVPVESRVTFRVKDPVTITERLD
jgi:hypothetical protein